MKRIQATMLHQITTLGKPRFSSPLNRFINDDWSVPEQIVRGTLAKPTAWDFELAGPCAKLFFDPKRTRAGQPE